MDDWKMPSSQALALTVMAAQLAGSRVRLVLGGLHLSKAPEHELDRIARELRKLGVQQVAPCHCTGARAISRLRVEYGADCLDVRLGEPLLLTTADAGRPLPGVRPG